MFFFSCLHLKTKYLANNTTEFLMCALMESAMVRLQNDIIAKFSSMFWKTVFSMVDIETCQLVYAPENKF